MGPQNITYPGAPKQMGQSAEYGDAYDAADAYNVTKPTITTANKPIAISAIRS